MKKGTPRGLRVVCLVLFALGLMHVQGTALAQADAATTAQLLGKAKALETRGRMDMAKQTWQQVLLVDPNNSDALAGMARAAKLEGKTEEANQYLNKLRSINPNDPNISRVETMGTAQDMSGQLQEAGRLAQAGQYARAMTIMRAVYGATPPAGDPALSYYETEAATDDGRPHAIAGLRELMDKYPQDSRYQITLGKILTYNPRTRAEGRKLLERHPNDPGAVEALRQSLVWDAQNPATAGDLRAYLAKHKDTQLSTALAQADAAQKKSGGTGRVGPAGPPPQTPEQIAAQAALREKNAESQAAYAALNAKKFDEAESRFQAIVAKDPQNAQALAGLGYVRMSQSNFGGAISYLEQSVQDGSKDAGVEKALRDSRFFYTMQVATAALNENDLGTAEAQFGNAAHMRPTDPSPLLGLGGTLLKAQQPAPAVGVFSQYVRLAPNDKAAWRGLFMAQYGAAQFTAALDTDRRVPAGVKRQLLRDPEYLRTLASVYQALGRDADAQKILRSALELPFPADSRGMRADMQLQYAALLSAAGHKDQSAGLYRQVLEADSTNINAYSGLIDTEHALGHDDQALAAIQSMPPQTYDQAMNQPGFPSTVAAIYASQGHADLAQQVLETFLSNEQQQGLKVSASSEVQLAGIYLQHGDTAHAFPLYREAVLADPSRTESWNGLLSSLHAAGRDQEARAEIDQIPPNVRQKLETDPAYLQTVGSIYSGLNQPQAAMAFYNRVQQHYAAMRMPPPADIDIQQAWLLFNAKNDGALFHQLMYLGGRQDLTDQQRLTVQTIWANWAVRRANQNIAEGNYKRAIAILNAAARAFPGNPDVLKALATGYASVGLPHQAVLIFRSQDLSTGSVGDYRASVGAALSDNDLKDAETWLRFGLDQYPKDGPLLVLASKFETARGDSGRAADYLHASLKYFPEDDPGLLLTDEMRHPVILKRLPPTGPTDLAGLLGEADPHVNRNDASQEAPVVERPYLPSYTGVGGTAPVQLGTGQANYPGNSVPYSPGATQNYGGTSSYGGTSGGAYQPGGGYPGGGSYPGGSNSSNTTAPSSGTTVIPENQPVQNHIPPANSTLGGYQPQSRVVMPGPVLQLRPDAAMEARYGPYVSYDPSVGVPHFAGVTHALGDGVAVTVAAGVEGVSTTARMTTASYKRQQTYTPGYTAPKYVPPATAKRAAGGAHAPVKRGAAKPVVGKSVAAKSVASGVMAPAGVVHPIHLGYAQTVKAGQESQTALPQDFEKASGYAPSRIVLPVAATTQSAGGTSLQAGKYPQATGAGQRGGAATPGVAADGTPVVSYLPASKPGVHRRLPPRAATAAVSERAAAIRANQQEAPEAMTGQSHPPAESFDTSPDPNADIVNTQFSQGYSPAGMQGSQVPQTQAPRTTTRSTTLPATQPTGQSLPSQTGDSSAQQYPQPNTRGVGPVTPRRRIRSTPAETPAPAQPQPAGPIAYPNYTAPLANPGYPRIGDAYPLAPAPTDYDLQQRNVPPLRGYFDPRVDDKAPLSDRQQAELDLALIEGSYSPWLGASVIGSYRSGTPGVDRMAGVEVPLEASAMLGRSVRVTAVPLAIFLNSGVLNTTGGNLGTSPIFGTVLGNSNQIYAQQFATGFGGEGQLTTNTFAIAGGYSAYGFLVQNVIGRAKWKPGNGHFTLFGGRDPVKETQLSYAGMRDPGQPNNFTLGPIWGGVVQTGGGIRFETGNEKSGLYLQGDGADLSGYHVLENRKYEGTMGAYFRVHVWPEFGTLNVGGTIFGEHYDYNERVETYGNGGYFSPDVYFLFAVPVTFTGHYRENLHYVINGSVGVQTFQEDSDPFYPLDPGTETQYTALNCAGVVTSAAQPCGNSPINSNTGLNYSIDAKMSYHVNEHWYIGAFLTGNNTNNYNTISGGFFARYLIRPQVQTVDYPTGLFPVEGFRPLRVP